MNEIDSAVLDNISMPNRAMAPFLWYGGKGNLTKWVIRHFPSDGVKVYVEPYAGAASLFWHLKKPYPVEVLNDIDGRIVNLFRVLQDKTKFEELAHRLIWTPYSRAEFVRALGIIKDCENASDIDCAWAFFVSQNQGFGGKAGASGDWGRGFVASRGMAYTSSKWRGRLKLLTRWHDRLTRVQIDNRDAIEVIKYWDTPETLFYIDPPYLLSTRTSGSQYKHEADDTHHKALVDTLLSIKGQAVLSGYDSNMYDPLVDAGWSKHSKTTVAHAAGRTRGSGLQGDGAASDKASRVEVLWAKTKRAQSRLL